MAKDGTGPDGRTGAVSDGKVSRSDSGTIDAVFDALADDRRRTVIEEMLDQSGWVGIDQLARRLQDRNRERDLHGWEGHDRIKAELYHVHLPKLAEVGIVDFDPGQSTVRIRDQNDRLELCREIISGSG